MCLSRWCAQVVYIKVEGELSVCIDDGRWLVSVGDSKW